jgi:hypothetical protein
MRELFEAVSKAMRRSNVKDFLVTCHVVSYASSAGVGTVAVISPPKYLRKFLRILEISSVITKHVKSMFLL